MNDHYKHGSVECIDALRSALGPEGFEAFCAGNVMKYIWRYRHKDQGKDLYKAKLYLDWLVDSKV